MNTPPTDKTGGLIDDVAAMVGRLIERRGEAGLVEVDRIFSDIAVLLARVSEALKPTPSAASPSNPAEAYLTEQRAFNDWWDSRPASYDKNAEPAHMAAGAAWHARANLAPASSASPTNVLISTLTTGWRMLSPTDQEHYAREAAALLKEVRRDALAWAASWIEGSATPSVEGFAKNMAMTLRAEGEVAPNSATRRSQPVFWNCTATESHGEFKGATYTCHTCGATGDADNPLRCRALDHNRTEGAASNGVLLRAG